MIGLLLRRPGPLNSPAARWAVNVLAVAGAALLVWSAVIHLKLWGAGYRDISVVGPLFLIPWIRTLCTVTIITKPEASPTKT